MQGIMKIWFVLSVLVLMSSPSLAASFHWVDRDGFHAVDSLAKVPLEHRRDLPMARHKTAFPFTREEDADGSMYIWLILTEAGMNYPYTAASDVRKSKVFRRTSTPQLMDVGWWQGYMALTDAKGCLLTAAGKVPLSKVEKERGKVTWYEVDLPEKAPVAPPASVPAGILAEADATLARLEAADGYHPHEEGDQAFEALKKEWARGEKEFEQMRRKYPESAQVLAKIGELYRRGYNLNIDGTWERGEAFLLRAEALDPNLVDAYLSLGAHYGDTALEHAAKAEVQFRKALSLAQGDKQARALWGLAMSLYYEGMKEEAVQTIDRLIELRPDDQEAKHLRDAMTFQDTHPDRRGEDTP